MLTWDVSTTSTDLCVWQCTFKFNHVWETTSPEMCNSCERNENIMLHKSALSLSFSCASRAYMCWDLSLLLQTASIVIIITGQTIKLWCPTAYRNTQGGKRADPVPCVSDRSPAVCTVSSRETVVCSFPFTVPEEEVMSATAAQFSTMNHQATRYQKALKH